MTLDTPLSHDRPMRRAQIQNSAATECWRGRGAGEDAERRERRRRRPQTADRRPQAADRRPQTADGTATAEAPAQTAAGQAASHQAHLARAPWDPATLRLRAPPEGEEDTHVYPKTRTRGVTALPSATARTAPALDR